MPTAEWLQKTIVTKKGFEPHHGDTGILMMDIYGFLSVAGTKALCSDIV